MLHIEYGRKVLIIIDEYDVPLQKAATAKNPYYEKILNIIENIVNVTFKKDSDQYIFKCIMTGCLKIDNQNIFTDVGNFVYYSIDNNQYAEFFGFTISEIEKLLKDCELLDFNDIIKKWYYGYRVGDKHLFCPWSVIQYCSDIIESENPNLEPETYWINTSGNDIIKKYLKYIINANITNKINRIEQLLNDLPQKILLQKFISYQELINEELKFNNLMNILLQTGYLTFTDNSSLKKYILVKIPNHEIRICFENKLQHLYSHSNPIWLKNGKKLLYHLMANEYEQASHLINNLLERFISVHNTRSEYFYHEFILGILSMIIDEENIKLNSELENNDGYTNITLRHEYSKTAIILELKLCENNYTARVTAANNAANKIINHKYAIKFINENFMTIYGMGLGCSEKHCVIKSLGNLAK